jgi:hypothetical protein
VGLTSPPDSFPRVVEKIMITCSKIDKAIDTVLGGVFWCGVVGMIVFVTVVRARARADVET